MSALNFPDSPYVGQPFIGPDGRVWAWDGSVWNLEIGVVEIGATGPTGPTGATGPAGNDAPSTLATLDDVTITSATAGNFLKYSGTAWVNEPIDLGADTVGDYIQSLSAGTGVTVYSGTGEGANASVAIGQAVGTTDSVTFANVTITNAPSQASHATTKSYVDSVAAGIDWHQAVKLATATFLPNSPTYDNGSSGVGSTLTATTYARLLVDGANATTGDRILVKNQTNTAHNGVYLVTEQGNAVDTYWVLTRSTDFDSSPTNEIKTGEAVFVTAGAINVRQGFVLTSSGSGTDGAHILNTDALTFTQFTGTSAFTAGDGMTQSGSTINVVTENSNRIVVNPDSIDLATVAQSNTSGSPTATFVSGITVDSYGRVTGKETSSVDLSSTVQKSLIDAKGDLIVGSADNSVARLAAGTDGYFLKANSGATNGVEWASVPTINTVDDIGDVVITSAANGQMLVFNGTNWVNQVSPSQEPMGHENKADSTISFDNGTRIFTIQPTSSSYTVWVKGKRFVKTTSSTVTLPDVTDLYYIYFDSAGTLQYQTTYFDWDDQAMTAYIYWNSTTSKAEFFADERHGVVLDWQTHEYLHRTRGAAIASGFGASNYSTTGDGSSDAHAKLDIANGTFFDEDLQVDVTHSATPASNSWEQVLQGNAEIPVFYRSGTAWVKDTATEFPLKQGTARPQYNSFSDPNWSATDITDGKFGISWIIATNNLGEPVIALLGQASYDTKGEAEAAVWEDLSLDSFPVFEFRPLYKIVYECLSDFTNTVNARFVGVYDLRRVVASGEAIPTTPVSDHGSMTGLSDDDHTQYLHKTETRAGITADISTTGTIFASTLSTNSSVVFEGNVADGNETILQVTEPTNDRVITLPDASGTVALLGAINLGSDTTGNYVADVSGGTGVSVSHVPGEGSTPTVSIGQAVGTTDNVTFAGATIDAIRVGVTGSNEIDTASGNLTIDSAGGTVTVDDNLVVSGDLTVNGTTVTVNSTVTTVDDPIITLGGDAAPASDDNKDRGVEFRWHNGVDPKVGFFGFDDSSGRLTFIPDATNTSEVFSGTLGIIDVGDVYLSGTVSTGTGGLVRATGPTISTPTIIRPSIDNPNLGYTTTATAAATTTLTSASNFLQYFTGTTTQTVTLPEASTMTLGQQFELHNNSTGTITVNSSGGNLVGTLPGGATALVTCILTSGTSAASWDFDFTGATSRTGSGSLVYSGSPTFTGTVVLPSTTQLLEEYVSLSTNTTLSLASHQYKVIEVNSASNLTITIPLNSNAAFPIGTTITVIRVGTGEVTIGQEGGVTVNNPLGARLRVQWSTATLRKRGTDTWLISGDLKV